MTGVIINNNEYQVSTGNTKIEYNSMGGESVGYSMYGANVPSEDIWVTFNPRNILSLPHTSNEESYYSYASQIFSNANTTYQCVFKWFATTTWTLNKPIKFKKLISKLDYRFTSGYVNFIGDGESFFWGYPGYRDYQVSSLSGEKIVYNTLEIQSECYKHNTISGYFEIEMEVKKS